MKLNVEELAREAGFEQVMRHKNGNSTVLPTPMFERLTRLIVERCAAIAQEYPKYGEATAEEIRNLLED